MEAERRLDELEARLDLKFKRREWLREAMTHTSWINERGAEGRDNERLEYLGDAVLELVAAEYLFNRFPTYDEGQLTQMRSSLVSTVALAGIGEQLRLGEALRLGRGAAKSGARRLTSLHANAFEAIVGAAFLDQGYRKAGRLFLSRIGDLSSWTDPNFKGRMQALAQERYGTPPIYRTLPDGNARPRQYLSQVSVEGGPVLGEGRGGTKQAAEQVAARAAIDLLVAPASKKRRRGRRPPTPEAEPSGAELLVALAQVADSGLPALLPLPDPGPAANDVAPPARRRRRRSRGSGGAAVGSAPAETGAPELAPAPPSPAPQAGSPSADPAPVRRRRRRSRAGGSGSGPGAPPGDDPASAPPPSTAVAAIPPEAELAAPTNPDESPDPSQRKRTHRGHRGGRRRSGRSAPPAT